MGNPHEFQSADNNGMEKLPRATETEVPSEAERDAQALARLGKKPILTVCPRHSTRQNGADLTKLSAALPLYP